jgi:Ca-activated chloride channel family protein
MMVMLEIKPTNRISGAFQFPNSIPVIRESIAHVNVFYRLPGDTAKRNYSFGVPYNYIEFHDLQQCYRFASAVAMFGTLLKESQYARQMNWNETIIAANESYDRSDPVQKEFIPMIEKAKKIYSKKKRRRGFN